VFEQCAERDLAAERLAQTHEHLHRVQRVAADREEGVVDADARQMQDFGPDAGDDFFG
jgi:hypothetical protein